MAYVEISRRAAYDIEEIERFSREKWGKRVADDYIDSIDQAIQRLEQNPNFLHEKAGVFAYLCFYRVRHHFLVCNIIEDNIYIVTVKHGSMDFPSRITELEPLLVQEAEFMHQKFLEAKKRT